MSDNPLSPAEGIQKYFPGDQRLREELLRAMRRLARTPRTLAETRENLLAKDIPTAAAEEIISILEQEGFLNDSRYAESYARFRIEHGYGPARIRRELIQKGVAAGTAEAALARLEEDFDEPEILRSTLAKQLRIKGEPRTPRELKNLGDFLTRRGFSPELIREELESHFDRVFGGGG
jgi:regulatory protein